MSNLIIENLINSSNKNLKFDFSKSVSENISFSSDYDYDNSLPIEINDSKNSWEHVYESGIEKLKKVYVFKSLKHMSYFISEYLTKINEYDKKADMLVKNNCITLTLHTEDILEVTDLDLQLAKYLDNINEDITFIKGL